MKKHFLALFSHENVKKTIILFALSCIMIIVSQTIGIADNLTGIAFLLGGMILLYFSILHPWRRVENYALLIGVCVGIIVLLMLVIQILVWLKKTEFISEGVVMIIVFLICLPGILTGIIGTLINAFRKK